MRTSPKFSNFFGKDPLQLVTPTMTHTIVTLRQVVGRSVVRDTSKLDENRQLGGGEQTDAAGSVPRKCNEEVTS